MRILKVFSFIILSSIYSFGQGKVQGNVNDTKTKLKLVNVSIYNTTDDIISKTNDEGAFEIDVLSYPTELLFYLEGYNLKSVFVDNKLDDDLNLFLDSKIEELDEVIVRANRKKIFQINRKKDFEETRVYAGKKNEVIILDLSMANLASNNARQVFSRIPGLNIFQNDDAGLQLNIGGRGLDPNRTSNFNTRQNSYDISADVLGYPESYYTPPAEAIREIQIIRGAASLQYGTQFGALINFILKKPPNKTIDLVSRNNVGSNNLYTNFTSIGGKRKNFSFYSFYNYKRGNGFRANSKYQSNNFYVHLSQNISNKTNVSGEITYMTYLAKQAGGLSDRMFFEDPLQSNRTRNWFELDWLLYNVKLNHKFN